MLIIGTLIKKHIYNKRDQVIILPALIPTMVSSKSVNIKWLFAGYPFLVNKASLSTAEHFVGINVPSTIHTAWGHPLLSNYLILFINLEPSGNIIKSFILSTNTSRSSE